MEALLHTSDNAMAQPIAAADKARPAAGGERALAAAFVTFTEVASSLERSYVQLQNEVGRLRRELENANSDLAHSQEENCRTRQHLNDLMDVLPCGVLEIACDGRVLLSNPEARRLWGNLEILPGPIRARVESCDSQGGELEYSVEGEPARWIAVRRSLLRTRREQSRIFIVQDVSRLKQLQREHEQLQRKHALAELSHVLAHEIRNPLASMELFAGLLAASALGEEQQGFVEHLQAGLRMLEATVNNVLQFHGEAKPQFAPTEMGEFLRSLQEFLRPLAQQSKVRFEIQHDLDGMCIKADRHRLQQVFLNLALNAIRHMEQGGRLQIAGERVTRDGGEWACLEISDTGPGIRPEHLSKIFEPGFTTRPGSPGLGLSVCRALLEQHGAKITVISPPQGVTFRLELPGAQS